MDKFEKFLNKTLNDPLGLQQDCQKASVWLCTKIGLVIDKRSVVIYTEFKTFIGFHRSILTLFSLNWSIVRSCGVSPMFSRIH